MAFQQKEWKNRLSENPTRRLLTPVDGSTPFQVDVTRAEGTIMQIGDPFNADNMNDLEQRIADAIGGGDENIAPIEIGPQSANAYTVGQLLIYNGQLYRVTSAIAVGNSLVEGVNIQATTLSVGIEELQNELTANGNRIYMDYKNGQYGYNTSAARGADTFVPFKHSVTQFALVGTAQNLGTASSIAKSITSTKGKAYIVIGGAYSTQPSSLTVTGATSLFNDSIGYPASSKIFCGIATGTTLSATVSWSSSVPEVYVRIYEITI